ncbi:MAG TPA: HAD-IIIA family hydrolase [Candidatus Nanoarchaeia archaeon]|nr:HAD-IIIA family hydrolase [Candidatus Nanoarchaeia archaeon]
MTKTSYVPHYYLNSKGDSLKMVIPIDRLFSDRALETVKSLDGRLALVDRDGVIIEKAPYHQYHKSPLTIKVFEGVPEAVKYLNQRKIPVVLITNQPGIHKGLNTENDFYFMNEVISETLDKHGAHLDGVFFCPHPAPTEGDDNVPKADLCTCRKPKPGMLETAIRMYHGKKEKTFYFDDFFSGIQAGVNAGVQSVYIATQHDEFEDMQKQIREKHPNIFVNFQYRNFLYSVIDLIK